MLRKLTVVKTVPSSSIAKYRRETTPHMAIIFVPTVKNCKKNFKKTGVMNLKEMQIISVILHLRSEDNQQ